MANLPEWIADYPDRKVLRSVRKRLYDACTWQAPELWYGVIESVLGEIEHFCPEEKEITVASDRETLRTVQSNLKALDAFDPGSWGPAMQDTIDLIDTHLEANPDTPDPKPAKKPLINPWRVIVTVACVVTAIWYGYYNEARDFNFWLAIVGLAVGVSFGVLIVETLVTLVRNAAKQ